MPIGNLGWEEDEVPFISLERGIATHVYAAFEPSLKGMCQHTVLYNAFSKRERKE